MEKDSKHSTLQCALISVTDNNLSLKDLLIVKHVVDDLVSQKFPHNEEPQTEEELDYLSSGWPRPTDFIRSLYNRLHQDHFRRNVSSFTTDRINEHDHGLHTLSRPNYCPKCQDETKK